MDLINKKLLQSKLRGFKLPDEFGLGKINNLIKSYQTSINSGNLDKTKEVSVQGQFLQHFFEEILGYSFSQRTPQEWSLEHEGTIQGGSADGILGIFTNTARSIRAVIELKDAKTDLDKKQSRNNNESPVDQAHRYAIGVDGCNWIIVSNFKEIRLYSKLRSKDYYEKFEILKLLDESELKRFLFLLSSGNLFTKEGKSEADNLVLETTDEVKDISNQFYRDYKLVRKEFFNHLVEFNPEIDKLVVLEKTQKILDRFIFVLFAEDTQGLLPNNISQETHKLGLNSRDRSDQKVWREFRNLFQDIDEGRHDINPPINKYNGGLFSKDEILDNLSIKDGIWKKLVDLNKYDFESTLDVNILGHIFEQSINDLEELKGDVIGEKVDLKKTKRKKDGIFYTPEYITKYIVENTVGRWLSDKKTLNVGLLKSFQRDQAVQSIIKVVDLIKENEESFKSGDAITNKIDEISLEELFDNLATWYTLDNLDAKTLRTNQNNPVWLNEIIINLKKACDYANIANCYSLINYFRDLPPNNNLQNIKILDPACGSGAFLNQAHKYLIGEYENRYQNEVDKKTENGENLDLFTYNPAQTNRSILLNNLYGVDLQPESVEISKLSLWLKTATKSEPLQNLDKNIKCGNSLIDDPEIAGDKAFDWGEEFGEVMSEGGFDVVIGNPPYGAKLNETEQDSLLDKYRFGTTESAILFILTSLKLIKDDSYLGFIIPKSFCYASNYSKLRDLVWDNIVEVVDCGKVWNDVQLEQVIILLQKGVKHENYLSKIRVNELFVNEYKIDKKVASQFGFLLNGVTLEEVEKARIIKQGSIMLNEICENRRGGMLQKFISDVGELKVIGGADIGREGIKSIKGRINKADIDDDKAYIKPNSILVQNIVAHIENPSPHIKITACMPDKMDYVLVDTINQITIKNNSSIKFIYAVLNSDILNWYFYNFVIGKAIRTIHFDSTATSQLPIPLATPEEQSQIANLVDQIMVLKKEQHAQKDKFLKLLESEFSLKNAHKPLNINTKLEKYYNLTFAELIAEIEKQKIKLTLDKKSQWQEYFEKEKLKIKDLESQINMVDSQIELRVRGLYGLGEAEGAG